MAFPTNLDSFTNPAATDKLNSPSHSAIETAQNTALASLETKVGVNSSAVTSTLDYLLKSTSSVDPGHKHTPGSGGTGVYSYVKGDILIASAATTLTKLTLGSDGQFLVADSVQTTGVKWFTPANNQLNQTFTAGQAGAAGDALYVSDASITGTVRFDKGITNTTNGGWGDTANQKIAMPFTVGGSNIVFNKMIEVSLGKSGSPVDNVICGIQADNAGAPSGTYLTSATIAASGLPSGSVANQTFTLATPYQLTAGTAYWLVLSRSGAPANTLLFGDTGGSAGVQYNGSAWSGLAADFQFKLTEDQIAGRVYKTNANVTGKYNQFIGFATTSYTLGSSLTVTIGGVAAGLSSLTIGSFYYLADSDAAIQTTAGSNSRKVGIALTATSIAITNIW